MKQKLSVYCYVAIFAIVIVLLGYCMQGFYESDRLDTSFVERRISTENAAYEATKMVAPKPKGTLNITDMGEVYLFDLKFNYGDFNLDCKEEKSKEYITNQKLYFHQGSASCTTTPNISTTQSTQYELPPIPEVLQVGTSCYILVSVDYNGRVSYGIVLNEEVYKKGIDVIIN